MLLYLDCSFPCFLFKSARIQKFSYVSVCYYCRQEESSLVSGCCFFLGFFLRLAGKDG